MSTAISKVYGTAMTGRCDKRQEMADSALDLTAVVTMLPCRGDTAMLESVFAPLGYTVEFTTSELDEKHPEWGGSRYVDLTLSGKVRLQDLLRHLYVLIPVFDRQKHYWVGKEEVDKLLRHGDGWLEEHPEKGGKHKGACVGGDQLFWRIPECFQDLHLPKYWNTAQHFGGVGQIHRYILLRYGRAPRSANSRGQD